MHPVLIDFGSFNIYSYGVFICIGFLIGLTFAQKEAKRCNYPSNSISDLAFYLLIGAIIGSRLLYVIENFAYYSKSPLKIVMIWEGGLVFFGGLILDIFICAIYLWKHKLPLWETLDIISPSIAIGQGFGRIGCFLNGCGFGRPTELPIGIRFPYNSYAYNSQVNPNLKRNRPEPRLYLPQDYFYYMNEKGTGYLKSLEELSSEQYYEVTEGKYRSLPVHPTQLYSSANAVFLCLLFSLFWKKSINNNNKKRFLTASGQTFALVFILYGITRFILEYIRDDNPFEYAWWAIYKGGTVSQNVSIYMIIIGSVLLVLFQLRSPKNTSNKTSN